MCVCDDFQTLKRIEEEHIFRSPLGAPLVSYRVPKSAIVEQSLSLSVGTIAVVCVLLKKKQNKKFKKIKRFLLFFLF